QAEDGIRYATVTGVQTCALPISRADLGIAKHAYVASRSGWFSDRATCFLASGRPVLHQDTGFPDWLPTTEGVLAFATPDEVIEGYRKSRVAGWRMGRVG